MKASEKDFYHLTLPHSPDVQPQEVVGAEEVLPGGRHHEVGLLVPDGVQLAVVADALLRVHGLLRPPLLLAQHPVHLRLVDRRGHDHGREAVVSTTPNSSKRD